MKTVLKFLFFFVSLFYYSQQDKNQIERKEIDELNIKIDNLEKQNETLITKLNNYETSKDLFSNVIDKVDNLYNNNFNRFIIFWGILGAVLTVLIPYYITTIQKKIIETKKMEILDSSTKRFAELEKAFSAELQNKYNELNEIINSHNIQNKDQMEKEFTNASAMNFYIASKVNELDHEYAKSIYNFLHAINKSRSVNNLVALNFYIEKLNDFLKKYNVPELNLDKERTTKYLVELKMLINQEEVDQDIVKNIIGLLE